jgi:PAS domain S-box-containing protein
MNAAGRIRRWPRAGPLCVFVKGNMSRFSFRPPEPAKCTWPGTVNLICGAVALLIVASGTAGWLLEPAGITSVLLGQPPMTPGTVAGLGLGAAGLFLLRSGPRRLPAYRRLAGAACGAGVALLGGFSFAAYLTGHYTGIDRFFLAWAGRSGGVLGHPSHYVSSGLILLGVAMLALDAFPRGHFRFSQLFALAAALVASLSLIGHIIGYEPFYQASANAGMGVHSAAGVLALSLGVLLARPAEGLVGLLTSPSHGGFMSRRLLPLPLLLTLVLCGLGLAGARVGLYGHFTGIWLLQLSHIVVLSFLIWITADYIDRMDKKRRQAQEELHRFFALSLDMLCIAGADGYFKRLNPAWEKVLGFSRDELLARPFVEFVHPEDRASTVSAAERLAAGMDVVSFENRYLCRDGSYKYLLWNATPAPERDTFYAAARDITERQRAEEEIREINLALTASNEKLELRNREVQRATELKSQFLASMSHELRTPLNAIVGFSDLLAQGTGGPLNEKQSRYVAHVRNGARHLLQLINDILDLSKVEAGQLDWQLENFSVREALPEVLSTVSPLATKRKIQIESEVARDVVVFADRVRFKQILYNLLSNAVKFTPEGGKARIESWRDAGMVCISVSDTGVGIPPEEQERIFEEFRQVGESTRGVREGTGLGLAIVKRLVEGQGGKIWVESVPGLGSRFSFTLPAASAAQETANDPVPGAPPPSARKKPLILIVDDEVPAAELLMSHLTLEGYATVTARSGAEALAKARDLQPDAITLDILMPGKSGWETLHQLKNDPATAPIPVVIVSVVDQKKMGLALGAEEYLVKPVSKEMLLNAIRKYVRARPDGPRVVLVVDDDVRHVELVTAILESAGYASIAAFGARQALEVLQRGRPDGIVLDLLMPEMDGFEVLSRMHQDPFLGGIPVFVVTAKDLTEADLELLSRRTQAILKKELHWKEELLKRMRLVVDAPAARTTQ